MTIEAVIWDFGGVLTSSPFDNFAQYERERGLPEGFLRRVNATNPDDNAWARFERSEITPEDFDKAFLEDSTALGHPVRGGVIMPLLATRVRPRMVAALKLCKQHFKVGCITNNWASKPDGVSTHSRAALDEVLVLFDEVIESAKAGVRKPDPAIYLMMCEKLGVEPAACVYLDDLGINCKPAHLLGMQAIKVVDEAQALADLARVTGLTFPELEDA